MFVLNESAKRKPEPVVTSLMIRAVSDDFKRYDWRSLSIVEATIFYGSLVVDNTLLCFRTLKPSTSMLVLGVDQSDSNV